MNNKRFFIDKDGRTIVDNLYESCCECVESHEARKYCNKLNTLYEENQQLEEDNDKLGEILVINGLI